MDVRLQLDLLSAWEAGHDQSSFVRGVALLRAAGLLLSSEDPTVGECERRLLTLRERLFGGDMQATTACPACGAMQEFELDVKELKQPPALNAEVFQFSDDNFDVQFRMPTVSDLLTLQNSPSSSALLQRCILSVACEGQLSSSADLPETLQKAIAERLSEADPQAETELALTCSECSHPWTELFDTAAYLWDEVHAWALRTLYDVHCLAGAYGWSEPEVLAVTPRRRSLYLEMVAG